MVSWPPFDHLLTTFSHPQRPRPYHPKGPGPAPPPIPRDPGPHPIPGDPGPSPSAPGPGLGPPLKNLVSTAMQVCFERLHSQTSMLPHAMRCRCLHLRRCRHHHRLQSSRHALRRRNASPPRWPHRRLQPPLASRPSKALRLHDRLSSCRHSQWRSSRPPARPPAFRLGAVHDLRVQRRQRRRCRSR